MSARTIPHEEAAQIPKACRLKPSQVAFISRACEIPGCTSQGDGYCRRCIVAFCKKHHHGKCPSCKTHLWVVVDLRDGTYAVFEHEELLALQNDEESKVS